MAAPEETDVLSEIQSGIDRMKSFTPEKLASLGVGAAVKKTAGEGPEESPSGVLEEINAGIARIGKSPIPPGPGATPEVAPKLGAPVGVQEDPLAEIQAGIARLKGKPAAISQPGAVLGLGGQPAVPAPPEEDISAPWSDRLSKRFEQAWNVPGEGVVGHLWGVANTPIISETDLEAFEKFAGGDPESAGGIFGGVKKGVYSLLGGLTSPLSLAFIIGTAGAGALADSGGVAALRAAKMAPEEIATVVKGSKLLAEGIKLGQTSKETTGLMELAGINSKTVTDGLDILTKAGLTSHDLIKGSLIRTATASALRGFSMPAGQAETIGKTAALLVDGGFAVQNIYGAALAAPRALDALKSGDSAEAAKLITEAAGLSGFGLLGTKAALKEAGGMMTDLQVKMGLKVKPSDENIQLQREFGIADRQMVEAGRTHELWAEGLRKTHEALLKGDPAALRTVMSLVEAGGDDAIMQRNYNLIAKSAGRDVSIPTIDLMVNKEIEGAPKTRAEEPTVIPEDKKRVPLYESDKYEGGLISPVFDTYHQASEVRSDGNPYVRISDDPVRSAKSTTNEGRTLMVQISSNLINEAALGAERLKDQSALDNLRGKVPTTEPQSTAPIDRTGLTPDELATQYYDKLYAQTRPGYARMHDFWEIPDWIARTSHFLPDADVYVVRNIEQAKAFLNSAKYDRVLFSALDVNKDIIKNLLYTDENKSGYSGRVDMGGYVDPTFFKDHPNVTWHGSLESLAQNSGVEFKSGVNYRHFQGSDVIPRLSMSAGCLHKCAFCMIANTDLKLTPKEVVEQQADAIGKLGSKLAYVNDKTFGQAKNYQDLADLNERIRNQNPGFLGFVVQTTAAQMNKIPEEFLAKSGIKYIELGIESFNDPLLKEMHKPATEALINKATDKLRKNKIALIPNILIGYPGETAETYANTMKFLKNNKDIISHANVYNLALYKDAELGKKMTTAAEGDFNENVLEKSWHKDPNVVKTFAGDLYGHLQEQLGQTPDVLQDLRPLNELTPMEAKQLSVGHRREVFTNVLSRLPDVKELIAVARAGSMGRDWYTRSIVAFDHMREAAPGYFKPEDADVWAGVLASTSPQQSVVMNMREALTFWKDWKDNGMPNTEEKILKLQKKGKIERLTNQGAKLPNILKAINREEMLPADKAVFFKVGNFARDLQKINKDPSVTSDSWMGVLFGVGPTEVAKASFYHALAVQTRLAAHALGWEPKQAQAAMWSFVKTLSEKSGWKATGGNYFKPEDVLATLTPEDFVKNSQDFADIILNDTDVRAQLHRMGVPINELDKKLAAIPRPAPVEGATEAISSDLLKRSAQRIGAAQQKLEGFTGYKQFRTEGSFDFGGAGDGDPSFDFGANVRREIEEAAPQTETPEFKKWLGNSKVTADDGSGSPKVVYHGTTRGKIVPGGQEAFSEFRTEMEHDLGAHFGTQAHAHGRFPEAWQQYGDEVVDPITGEVQPTEPSPRGQRIYPVYLAIENPLRVRDMTDWSNPEPWMRAIGTEDVPPDVAPAIEKLAEKAQEDRDNGNITKGFGKFETFTSDVKQVIEKAGYDGIVYKNEHEGVDYYGDYDDSYIAFHPSQIKSATGNLGTFDPKSADIRYDLEPAPVQSARPKTETPEFKKWFEGSQMVDVEGKPIVVYHATQRRGEPFAEFDTNKPYDLGAHFGTAEQAHGRIQLDTEKMIEHARERLEEGPEIASPEGAQVYPVYLSIKNAVRLPDMGSWNDPTSWRTALKEGEIPQDLEPKLRQVLDAHVPPKKGTTFLRTIKQLIEDAGYDSIVYENEHEGTKGLFYSPMGGYEDSYIAFHPEQIKSATGNLGTFDPSSPDIRKEFKEVKFPEPPKGTPTDKPLPGGAFMFDPQGNPIRMEGESHAQWVARNFPEYQGARWGLDKTLDKGYIRVLHAPGHQLMVDVSSDAPNWKRNLLKVEDQTLMSGDRPITVDINRKGTLVQQLSFENSEDFRTYFSRDIAQPSISEFANVADPNLPEKLAPFLEPAGAYTAGRTADQLAASGMEKLGVLKDSTSDSTGRNRNAGLFTNQRGENTLVLSGEALDDFNRVTKNLMLESYGVSTPASVTGNLVDFLKKNPLNGMKALGGILDAVRDKPLAIIRLTGAHPFETMLHEHTHGAVGPLEAAVIQSKLQGMPGFDEVVNRIKNIRSTKGTGYTSNQAVWEELMPRLVAGQMFNRGIPHEQVINLVWEALNSLQDQSAYEKVVGNLHPEVRGKLYEYLQSERTEAERRGLREQSAGAEPGGSEAQAGPDTGAPERGQTVLRAGDATARPIEKTIDKHLRLFKDKWSKEIAEGGAEDVPRLKLRLGAILDKIAAFEKGEKYVPPKEDWASGLPDDLRRLQGWSQNLDYDIAQRSGATDYTKLVNREKLGPQRLEDRTHPLYKPPYEYKDWDGKKRTERGRFEPRFSTTNRGEESSLEAFDKIAEHEHTKTLPVKVYMGGSFHEPWHEFEIDEKNGVPMTREDFRKAYQDAEQANAEQYDLAYKDLYGDEGISKELVPKGEEPTMEKAEGYGNYWVKIPGQPGRKLYKNKAKAQVAIDQWNQYQSARKAPPTPMYTALKDINIKEGFTVNPKTGFVPQKEGFSVEAIPERRKTLDHDVNFADIEAFVAKNKTLLDEHPDLYVGGWGRELNLSTVLADEASAKEFGKKVDQKAAWDFAKGDTLDLGGTGKQTEFPDFPLDERLEFIRKNSIPEAKDFNVSRDLSDAPKGTSDSRLEELAAQQHIKKNYSKKEIDEILQSYDTKRVTDKHRELAKSVKDHFSDNFERANKGGALEEGLEHYVTHMWEKDVNNPAANRLLAESRSGNFAVNTSMARHRTFEHAVEGQLLGRKLRVTDPISLAAHNGNTFDRVLAARDTLARLQDKGLRASDGRPMTALAGSGSLIQGEDGENPAVLVHPDQVRNIRIADKVVKGLQDNGDLDRLLKEGRIVKYGDVAQGPDGKPVQHYAWATNDYLSVNHPAFQGWQFASQDTNGNPVLVRGDLKVHPEAHEYIKRQLDTQSPLAKHMAPVFKAGSEAKGILLSFDVFHLVQESLRAMMTGVSPFGVEKWNLRTNPLLGKLVENGLTLKSYADGMDSFQEGMMVGHSKLLGKVPVLGHAAGWFQDYLFKKYVPSLKARAAEHLYEKYKRAYPEYPESKILALAAEDTNMRFGGLNLRREGRALMTEDAFRLVALAPDWLESELRSMSRAMGGDGKVMRRDLAKVAIAMWLSARVLNYLNTGNAHYEAPFGVAYKDDQGRDKTISLRTLPTDMLHAVTDPLKFMRYRFSPLERTINTVYSGRDEQGRRLPTRDLVWDILGDTVVPLPLQNVTKKMSGLQSNQSWKELGARAAGAQVLSFKTEAAKKAAELSADRSESGPVDTDKLRAHTAKMELEDRVRIGDVKPEELWSMVDQGLLHHKDAQSILKTVQSTRGMEPDMAKLYTRASRLQMPDFLLVWDEATSGEKSALTKLMLKKKVTYFKKAFTEMTATERMKDPTYLKLRKMFPEQPF